VQVTNSFEFADIRKAQALLTVKHDAGCDQLFTLALVVDERLGNHSYVKPI
jgi:hypothetical protein